DRHRDLGGETIDELGENRPLVVEVQVISAARDPRLRHDVVDGGLMVASLGEYAAGSAQYLLPSLLSSQGRGAGLGTTAGHSARTSPRTIPLLGSGEKTRARAVTTIFWAILGVQMAISPARRRFPSAGTCWLKTKTASTPI